MYGGWSLGEKKGGEERRMENTGAALGEEEDELDGVNVREQDRFLPIANISRIMKKALPGNAKIAKDAKETVQECVSEFISFITSEASDKCQREKRKTINGDDLLWAMMTLGFEDYVEPLKLYLNKFRDSEVRMSALWTHLVLCVCVCVWHAPRKRERENKKSASERKKMTLSVSLHGWRHNREKYDVAIDAISIETRNVWYMCVHMYA